MSRVAALQMNSTDELAANLAAAGRLLRRAAESGAELAVLPENFAFMGAREKDKLAHAEPAGRGPIQDFLAACAREHCLWIVAGTLPVSATPEKVFAASLVFDPQGQCRARYDKMHLFDVDVMREGKTESYRESRSIEPGSPQPVTVATPPGQLGLSVCYDLRFPELYRAHAAAGAELLSVPSAFTEKTGAAHWELLLRARAVENQCYVIAPNQCGQHPGGRRTWGHSLIADPWGRVLACQPTGEGVVLADIDLSRLRALRAEFPCLNHQRLSP